MIQLATYLTALQRSEKSLADGFSAVAAAHRDEPEILETAPLLAALAESSSRGVIATGPRRGSHRP